MSLVPLEKYIGTFRLVQCKDQFGKLLKVYVNLILTFFGMVLDVWDLLGRGFIEKTKWIMVSKEVSNIGIIPKNKNQGFSFDVVPKSRTRC